MLASYMFACYGGSNLHKATHRYCKLYVDLWHAIVNSICRDLVVMDEAII